MCLFLRRKLCYLIGTILFILLSYKTAKQLYEISIIFQPSISRNGINRHQISNNSLSNISIYYKNENKCNDNLNPSLSNVIRHSDLLNYLGFVLRSHSLFYCSVPKVATRTLLTFITYLHIRDDLIPLITTNHSVSNILNFDYFNQTNLFSIKTSTNDSLSILTSFLTHLMINSSKIDLWSMYQKKVFPYIRLRTLSDPSIIFSSKFVRVIFVRHPLERLASAYVDKISSLKNQPFSLYDNLRRTICRKYSSFYLTYAQRISYRTNKGLLKRINEPCQKIIPTFEHFVEYLMSDSLKEDVHWKPYSKLCHVCLFKYNFIGKFETIENDLKKLILYLGLKTNDWINEYYFTTGKTKENYKSLYSKLNKKLICSLKYFYKDDFKLFDYRFEDYLPKKKKIRCSSIKKHIIE